MKLSWIKYNYYYFLLIGGIGLLMRQTLFALPLPYRNMLHAHSHTAFLGWVYPTLFLLILFFFLPKEAREKFHFRQQFQITHLIILGIMLSFLWQSYGLYSIIFSSLFQLLNYWFIYTLLKALKTYKSHYEKTPIAYLSLNVALWSLFVSTLATWGLAILMVKVGKQSDWYKMAIYMFLHFLYNGWIIFALLALFLRKIEAFFDLKGKKIASKMFLYHAVALIPAFFLSLLNLTEASWVQALAILSAILQLYGLFFLLQLIWQNRTHLLAKNRLINFTGLFVVSGYSVKLILQLLSVLPQLRALAFNNHQVIISYIHLVMLGVISLYIIYFLAQNGILSFKGWLPFLGLVLFLGGFTATELILGFGYVLDIYHQTGLSIFTALLALGIILILFGFKKEPGERNGKTG